MKIPLIHGPGPRTASKHAAMRRKMTLIRFNVFRKPDWRRDLRPEWITVGNQSDLCLSLVGGIIVAQITPAVPGEFQ